MIYKDGEKIEDICKKCGKELVFHGNQPKEKDKICLKCKGAT